jgi:hypothetical protein
LTLVVVCLTIPHSVRAKAWSLTPILQNGKKLQCDSQPRREKSRSTTIARPVTSHDDQHILLMIGGGDAALGIGYTCDANGRCYRSVKQWLF